MQPSAAEKAFLLLISQQDVLNKSCKECFCKYLLFLWFFVGLKCLRLWGKNLFLGLYAKANFSYNIHVRNFTLGQCIVYIVSNKSTERFFKFLLFNFYIIFYYKIFCWKIWLNIYFLKVTCIFQKFARYFYRGNYSWTEWNLFITELQVGFSM